MKPTVCTYLCDGKLLLRCIKPSSQTPILHRCVCVCTSVLCYSLQMMQEHRSTITTDLLFACLLTVYCQIGTYSVRFMVSSKYKSSTSNAWCVFVMSRESDLLKDGVSSNPSAEEQDLMREEAQKMSSVLPTMWLGAQNGW